MIDPRLFDTDDYSAIQTKYFAELRRQRRVDADPSGWLDTYAAAEPSLPNYGIPDKALAHYLIDDGDALGEPKDRVCSLMSIWNGATLGPNEVTLCPSCGNASLIVLTALREIGIDEILFETPAYFATIEQASLLRIPFRLIPTYRETSYSLPDLQRSISRKSKTVVWLTQPRASLGFDQPTELIDRLVHQTSPYGYVVVDEATDQSYPTHLGRNSHSWRDRLIRLRSFTKGIGLNGFRLAAIIHPPRLRQGMTDSIETLGGSLDVNSLYAVVKLAERPGVLAQMLMTANLQVRQLRTKADRLARGSNISINPLTNGYIGSMVLDLRSCGRTDRIRRTCLLEWCRRVRTPIILGSSMYAAKAPPTEMVRLNFFSAPDHITRGIANILGLWG